MFGFRSKNSESVADLAVASMPDENRGRFYYTMPWYTPLVWIVMIVGPTAYLYQDGDIATAIAWAVLTLAGWLGSVIGLARPLIYLVILPLSTMIAKWGGGQIQPKVSELIPNQPLIVTAISNGLAFLAAIMLLHLFVCRPILNFIARRPTLAQWNAGGGFLLMSAKAACLIVLVITVLAYTDTRPDWKRQLARQEFGGQMNLGKMIDKATLAARDSRAHRWIGDPIPWDEVAKQVKMPSMGAGGFGVPGGMPGMIPGGMPAGMGSAADMKKATGSFKKLKKLKF
ncbi:MAG: CvpA family protein [Planctomycetota bacterium]